MRCLIPFLLLGCYCTAVQARAYEPLGQQISSGAVRSVRADARPVLPGARAVELELLEDALRRKMPHTIGVSRENAHQKIIRNAFREPMKRAHIKGILAEAMWLEKNQAWGYVQSPTASQHDVYTWKAGRRAPYTAQIKTHGSANPAVYARDMLSDHRSNLFLLPDDHVAPLTARLNAQMQAQQAAGNFSQAQATRQQLNRVRGLGFTSQQLDAGYTKATRAAWREQKAGYVSLGAAGAMVLGPMLWDILQGKSVNAEHAAYAGLLIGTERLANYAMTRSNRTISPASNLKSKPATSFVKGSMKSNVATGIALLVVEAGRGIYDNGGINNASKNPGFYSNLGGSVSAFGAGTAAGWLIGSGAALLTMNPAIGGVIGGLSGAVIGGAAYMGGEHATRAILYGFNPEFMRVKEKEANEVARKDIDRRLGVLLAAEEVLHD